MKHKFTLINFLKMDKNRLLIFDKDKFNPILTVYEGITGES